MRSDSKNLNIAACLVVLWGAYQNLVAIILYRSGIIEYRDFKILAPANYSWIEVVVSLILMSFALLCAYKLGKRVVLIALLGLLAQSLLYCCLYIK